MIISCFCGFLFFVALFYQRRIGITSQMSERVGSGSVGKPNLPGLGTETGLKRVLKSVRFTHRIRFGWETEPTGPGAETVIISKIDPYGALLKQLRECFDICRWCLAGVVFADVRCCGVINFGFAGEKR